MRDGSRLELIVGFEIGGELGFSHYIFYTIFLLELIYINIQESPRAKQGSLHNILFISHIIKYSLREAPKYPE